MADAAFTHFEYAAFHAAFPPTAGATNAAHPSAATEHTGKPQLGGYVCTHNTSNGTEHADAARKKGNKIHPSSHHKSNATELADDTTMATPGRSSVGACSHDEQNAPTEHVNCGQLDDATEHVVLLTIDEAHNIRRCYRGQSGVLHTKARQYLNKITEAQSDELEVYVIDEEASRWKEYLSMHDHWKEIIGTGIIKAQLETIRNTKDPNRGNHERIDYVFYRADRTFVRVHPGTKPKKTQNYTSVIRAHAPEQCKSTKLRWSP